ncbi:helix-turn-helix domain-containing protein [Enterococcus sp. LJL128]|uniref:helix-turn-helix domain-containing protein n=1 Tax=Enterococcus sp. LJL51 TaxID=3416656 RepID=UPI003CEBAD76
MERLLSTDMSRRILLLNLLYGSEDWLTTEKLSKKLHCSTKTVMMDCRYIEGRWPEHLSIDMSKKYGVKLSVSAHHSIHDIYTDIIKNSDTFSLLETVFFHPGEYSESIEKRCFTSSSSIYRLSKRINIPLRERNIMMERNPFIFSGKSEREIRYFFTSYFVEVYGIHHWPFQLDKEKILELVKQINEDFQLYLSDIRLIHMVFSIAVTLTRINQGFSTENEWPTSSAFSGFLAQSKVPDYQEKLDSINSFSKKDQNYDWYKDFYYTVFWWIFGQEKETDKEIISSAAASLIEDLVNELDIPIDAISSQKIKQVIENIYYLHQVFPYKKHIIYSRFFYSSKSIRQNFILFSNTISKTLSHLEKRDQFPWKSMYLNEILHDFMMYWKNLPTYLYSKRSPISITVLSDLGKEHAEVLGSILKLNFCNTINVVTQNTSYFDFNARKSTNNCDLYVSNHHIDYFAKDKIVVVEDILSPRNIIELRKIIERSQLRAHRNAKTTAANMC